MHEETVLTRKKPGNLANKIPVIMGVAAIITLLLTAIMGLVPYVLSCLNFMIDGSKIWQSSLFWQRLVVPTMEVLQWVLIGLILPVCLLISGSSTKKATLGKLFFVLALLVLLWQLGNVVSYTLYNMVHRELVGKFMWLYYAMRDCVINFPGSRLLTSLWNCLEVLEYANDIEDLLYSLTGCLAICFSNLFHILTTLLCTIGFAVMGFSVKKKN